MIFRRIKAHVAKEDWFAVFIDFLIVVFGVFMGFQVQEWNENRSDSARAQAYLERIHADIGTDMKNYTERLKFWQQVADYGAFALDYAHSENVEKTANWSLLLAIFQSSQTAEFSTTQTTYDELKSAGELRLIGNVELRTIISSYYTNSGNPALTERPKYREHVRGYIPISVQHYIWDNCYSSDAYGGQIMFECDAPAQLSNAGEIVDSIVTNEELMREMRYWMSTLRVASIIGQDRIEAAIDLQKIIEAELNGANPETTP